MKWYRELAGSTVVVSALFAGSAFAADMPAPAPAPAPAPPAPVFYDWTGIYAGVHAGYSWGDFKASYPGASFDADSTFGSVDIDRGPFAPTIDTDGWHGGGQIGANWQVDQWVFGLEGDISWSGADGSRWTTYEIDWDSPGPAGSFDVDATLSTDLKWFGTVRGRIGYAFDEILIYGTGGLAFARAQLGVAGNVDDADADDAGFGGRFWTSNTQTHTGWTIGAGAEAALTPNVSLKAEYLYMDFGSETYNLQFPASTVAVDGDLTQHVVRAGLNYRFSW